MARNVFVAQSGGPSAVINNSIRGVIHGVREAPEGTFGTVYGGRFGILGALREELLDISAQSPEEIELLEVTPAAGALGSCRYKLPKVKAEKLREALSGADLNNLQLERLPEDVQDYARIIQVFHRHNIGYFFYAGGNDSMDTAYKVRCAAEAAGLQLICTGVPKTIDNDVGDPERKLVDHTPGYGSTARYWRDLLQSANEENAGSCTSDPVLIMQVMGRKVGYLPAAARLADPERTFPLVIILAEMLTPKAGGKGKEAEEENRRIAAENLAFVEERIAEVLGRHGRAVVVLSEGAFLGTLSLQVDLFGHEAFGTGVAAATLLAMQLNRNAGSESPGLLKRLEYPLGARYNVPGTDQRGFIGSVSAQDLKEAFESGRHAVSLALKGGGVMATIKRAHTPDGTYRPVYDGVPLEVVAAVDRSFPAEWIDRERADVTDEFVRYAMPLIRTDCMVEREFHSLEDYFRERDAVRADCPLSVVLPLVGNRRRFAQFREQYAEKKLLAYLPARYRTG